MKRIVIIFFILIGAYLLYSFIQNFSIFKSGNYTSDPLTDSIHEIEIDISSLNLEIIPDNRDNVKVDFDGKGKIKVDEKRDRIVIKHEKPMIHFISLFNRGEMKVYIPKDYHKKLDIDMGSGSVLLAGSHHQPYYLEQLSIDMSSGVATLNHLIIDQFSFDVASGNIEIDHVETKDSEFEVRSGNIRIDNFVGPVRADISSGKFALHMKELKDFIDMKVSSGIIDLDLPENADFTLNGKVSSGKISYDFPLTVKEHDGRNIHGYHLSGKYPIHIKVSSGNVKIY